MSWETKIIELIKIPPTKERQKYKNILEEVIPQVKENRLTRPLRPRKIAKPSKTGPGTAEVKEKTSRTPAAISAKLKKFIIKMMPLNIR